MQNPVVKPLALYQPQSIPIARTIPVQAGKIQKNETVDKQTEPIISDKAKIAINLTCNGIAAASNALTFLNGNFHFTDSIQDKMEPLSAFLSKCATVSQGLINATIAFEKKNVVALLGGLIELPIALFISGFNLYLARGISAGMNQMDSIISRTKKRDSQNHIIHDEQGNERYYDSFSKEGWLEGFKILMKHFPKLTREISSNPLERSGLFSRSFFLCSIFMIIGPIVSFLVNEKLGAIIRHTFGGLAGVALATDLKKSANTSTSDQNRDIARNAPTPKSKGISNYAMSGILWVLAAIPDVLKRFDFISEKMNNGTELALCLDRLAGLFFIFGNQGTEDKKIAKPVALAKAA